MRRHLAPAGFFHRLVAAGSAALVLALALFAASPELHDSLHRDRCKAHAHDPAAEGDRCAVVLFASGVEPAPAPLEIAAPAAAWRPAAPAAAEEIFLTTPRYLRQPERGPPMA